MMILTWSSVLHVVVVMSSVSSCSSPISGVSYGLVFLPSYCVVGTMAYCVSSYLEQRYRRVNEITLLAFIRVCVHCPLMSPKKLT